MAEKIGIARPYAQAAFELARESEHDGYGDDDGSNHAPDRDPGGIVGNVMDELELRQGDKQRERERADEAIRGDAANRIADSELTDRQTPNPVSVTPERGRQSLVEEVRLGGDTQCRRKVQSNAIDPGNPLPAPRTQHEVGGPGCGREQHVTGMDIAEQRDRGLSIEADIDNGEDKRRNRELYPRVHGTASGAHRETLRRLRASPGSALN